MNNWEASPKKEFDRRRLERCYQLDYKDIEYKEECLSRVQSYEKQPEKKMKKRTPYWHFWKVVFAGWLIRYPRQIFKMIGTGVLFMIFMLIMATGGFKNIDDPQYNNGNANEVISE